MIKLVLNITEVENGVKAVGGLLSHPTGGHTAEEHRVGVELLDELRKNSTSHVFRDVSKHHATVKNPDDNWTNWEDLLPPDTFEDSFAG